MNKSLITFTNHIRKIGNFILVLVFCCCFLNVYISGYKANKYRVIIHYTAYLKYEYKSTSAALLNNVD